jgi:hypothetical protein
MKRDKVVWLVVLLIGRSSMSLTSLPIPPIPEDVVCVAHAAFPCGNVFMQIRDTLRTISNAEESTEFPYTIFTHRESLCRKLPRSWAPPGRQNRSSLAS